MAFKLTAGEDDNDRRLDRILRRALPELPLSALHRLLRRGEVLVGGVPCGGERRVKARELIEINGLAGTGAAGGSANSEKAGSKETAVSGRKTHLPPFPLEILYEGEGLLILNKEAGRIVHGKDSLEDSVRNYLKDKIPPSLSFRPGPLHRLDKPTSGIIVFSSSLDGARYFSGLIRERRVRKLYLAIADGIIKKGEVWEDLLLRDRNTKTTFVSAENAEGKHAGSEIVPVAVCGGRSLIIVEIKTGRTHQIRAQAASRGYPLSGDTKYGGRPLSVLPTRTVSQSKTSFREAGGEFFLHAYSLEFTLPSGKAISVTAPLPIRFGKALDVLFGPDVIQLIENANARQTC